MSDDFGDEKKFLDCFWKRNNSKGNERPEREREREIPEYFTCTALTRIIRPSSQEEKKTLSRRTESAIHTSPPLPSTTLSNHQYSSNTHTASAASRVPPPSPSDSSETSTWTHPIPHSHKPPTSANPACASHSDPPSS